MRVLFYVATFGPIAYHQKEKILIHALFINKAAILLIPMIIKKETLNKPTWDTLG